MSRHPTNPNHEEPNRRRHFRLIACNVLMREICRAIAEAPHAIDPEFTELGEHVHSQSLQSLIQRSIDRASAADRHYDAILLGYGLCGNATVGLVARGVPLVIPRAHDCCTLLLGSREAFQNHFGDNPSRPFGSPGYLERGEYHLRRQKESTRIVYGDGYAELVEQYGRDNAEYIWRTMHPEPTEADPETAVFIEVPELASLDHRREFSDKVAAEGKKCVCLPGDLRLLRGLLAGAWNPDEFLMVPPRHRIVGRYDWRIVLAAEPATRTRA